MVERSAIEGAVAQSTALAEALNLAGDRVRWGPIVAGIFTTTTTLLLLGLLGYVFGTAAGLAGGDAGTEWASASSALLGGLAMIVAFLAGGFVAGRSAAVFDRRWGALNGALVFFVGLPVLLWLGASSLGAVLGTIASFTSALSLDPQRLSGIAERAQSVPIASAASASETGAWIALIGLVLALLAGAAGGALGTRRKLMPERILVDRT